jgi:hypothetical protein
VAKLHSGENHSTIFIHLGENGSERKLKEFQEKNQLNKIPLLPHRLALQAVDKGLLTYQLCFRESATSDGPSTTGSLGSNTLS